MRTITRVRAADFAQRMTAMRIWLDEHRFEPSRFKYSEDSNDVLIDVEFKVAAEAAAFSARFNGGGT
jgi:outer membrane lipoprotein-sorting protein